jgi:hypothetical protein
VARHKKRRHGSLRHDSDTDAEAGAKGDGGEVGGDDDDDDAF